MVAVFFLFRGSRFFLPAEVLPALILVWMLSFFRDPERIVPRDESVLLAPADGTITDIEHVDDDPSYGESAVRIGIFLSVFNVHINRAPCSVRIEKVTYKKGEFRNAMAPESGRVNESNDILMTRVSAPEVELLVRQVSGAIARHIVCAAREGDSFAQGERFGMIKFGSRTELYLPRSANAEVLVKIGDKVRAGLSRMVRFN
jgi:phosphatidylserine decarboxylase